MRPDRDRAASAPADECVAIDVDASGVALHAQIRAAFAQGAPAVVVLCAAGAPLGLARQRLRALDARLGPLAVALGARVSRSATEGLAAWAASRHGPVGVDVQRAPATLDADLLDAALHPDERRWLADRPDAAQAFARLWAAKEAALKSFGVGLAFAPRELAVLPTGTGWQLLEVATLGRAWLSRIETPGAPEIAIAVALNAGFTAPG